MGHDHHQSTHERRGMWKKTGLGRPTFFLFIDTALLVRHDQKGDREEGPTSSCPFRLTRPTLPPPPLGTRNPLSLERETEGLDCHHHPPLLDLVNVDSHHHHQHTHLLSVNGDFCICQQPTATTTTTTTAAAAPKTRVGNTEVGLPGTTGNFPFMFCC